MTAAQMAYEFQVGFDNSRVKPEIRITEDIYCQD